MLERVRIIVGLVLLSTGCAGSADNFTAGLGNVFVVSSGGAGGTGGAGGVGGSSTPPSVVTFSCPATAVAQVPFTCTVLGAASAGEPQCSLTWSAGSKDIGACAQPRAVEARLDTPGSAVLTLTVRDSEGRTATQNVTVSVMTAPVNNRPPVISQLSASPTSGAVPFTTTLAFQVSDADGDALICELDVGANGTVDQAGLNCAAGTATHSVTAVGPVVLRLVVRDNKGGQATRDVTVTGQTPTQSGDVRVVATQWVQTVAANSLKLIPGKAALLRAWVIGNGIGPGLTVSVTATSAGNTLGTVNMTAPASLPTSETPAAAPTNWFLASIPAAWIAAGVEVAVTADPGNVLTEPNETNNRAVATMNLGRANQLSLTNVPVVQSGRTGVVPSVEAIMLQRWPLKAVVQKARAPYTFNAAITATGGWSQLLTNMNQVRSNDGSSRNYYGWIDVNFGSGVAGIGMVGRGVAVGRDDSVDTFAHELGHNFGRDHAPCGTSGEASYPYAGAKIGVWGFDGTAWKDPARFVDLMSYCTPEWISDYTYNAAQSFLQQRTEFAPGAMLNNVREGADGYLLAGTFNGTSIELRPVYRMRVPPSLEEDGAPRPLQLTLQFADGTKRVVMAELTAMGDVGLQAFTVGITDARMLLGVEASIDAKVLGAWRSSGVELAPSASAERVSPTEVLVKWPALIWPHAAVTHVVDGERTTLTLDAQGGAVTVRTDGLEHGMFEVSLSDGVGSQSVRLEMP